MPARTRFSPGIAWSVAGITTVLCLGVFELLLRWLAPVHASPYRPDDNLLVSLVPGARKEFRRLSANGGTRIVWSVNSAGFRGAEFSPERGQHRILVYGDSNVAAEFSELPATFPAQLARQLTPRDVEVINAGVVGYGPDQVNLRLPQDVPALRPALVIVVVFADNDYGDLLRNRIYGLDARGELVLQRYRLAPELRQTLEDGAYPHGLRRLQLSRYAARLWQMIRLRSEEPHSLEEYVATYLERSRERGEAAYARYLTDDPADRIADHPFHDYFDADIAMLPGSPSARLKLALMEKVVKALGETAASLRTPLAIVVLPSVIDVCERYDVQVDSRRYPDYERERLSRFVAGSAASAGVPNLDLYAPFRALDPCALYFDDGDGHWNEAGQAAAARLTAEFITTARLLAPP